MKVLPLMAHRFTKMRDIVKAVVNPAPYDNWAAATRIRTAPLYTGTALIKRISYESYQFIALISTLSRKNGLMSVLSK